MGFFFRWSCHIYAKTQKNQLLPLNIFSIQARAISFLINFPLQMKTAPFAAGDTQHKLCRAEARIH